MSNREIDILCAEKIFGWKRKAFDWWESDGDGVPRLLPALSTDPAASKQLRDRMRELGWLHSSEDVALEPGYPTAYKSRFRRWGASVSFDAKGSTEMLADCLAALKAVGVQEEEE